VLAVMKALIEELGGQNLAGDAKDTFHQSIMPEAELTVERKGWRVAWLGKVTTGMTMERKHFPKHRIFIVTNKGGPETDWEQEQIRQKILPSFGDQNIEELHFTGFDALLDYVYAKACIPAADGEAWLLEKALEATKLEATKLEEKKVEALKLEATKLEEKKVEALKIRWHACNSQCAAQLHVSAPCNVSGKVSIP